MGCLFRLIGLLIRLAVIAICIAAIIWALGQLSVHNVIDLAHSWLRFAIGFQGWINRQFGVKGNLK